MKNLIDYREDAREMVKQLYKDETGKPIILTDGQCDIFNLIFKRFSPRVHIETFTRYGKSLVTALAILTRVSTFPEKFALVAGNDDQARIIMSYVIQHIFDNEYTKTRFLVGKGESEENIRRYKNKDRLNFVIKRDKGEKMLLGELFITNAQGALGFGAPNVVMDESALVPDQDEALVFRMLGDQTDNFYVKIGNPWDMLHFRKSFEDPAYFKYVIDYKQGLMEGRISPELVEEARKKPFFDVLYECKFPPEGRPDDEGWMPLLTRDEVDKAIVDIGYGFGVNKLGCDVAGEGRNFSVIVQRHTNLAELILRIHTPDTMEFADRIINLKKSKEVKSQDIFIDKNGVGKGVFDITAKELEGIQGVNVGERPFSQYEGELYLNLRAKLFWELRRWILGGGKLLKNKDYPECWYELCGIKYNKKIEGMRGKLQIMSKEKMGKEGIESPDCFIAGTQILTPQGNINIENLKEGDDVITPFGNRTIIKKWEVETDKLIKVSFSNGNTLTGKPKHKILTKRGWCELDTLQLTDIIEVRSNLSIILWKIKKLLFIKEKNIGLRKMVDIFMPIFMMVRENQQEKKKHYIVEFGKIIISKKYLLDLSYTIKTIIRKIIYLITLNWLRVGNIAEKIWQTDLVINCLKNQMTNILVLSVPLPLYGIDQKKVENGTGNILRNNGKIQRLLKENVLFAEKNLRDISKLKDFAVEVVNKNQDGRAKFITQIKEYVYFVKKNLWRIGIGIQNVAVGNVEQIIGLKTKVYNLTLDRDNVYYANGILVENCADALSLTFFTPDFVFRRVDDDFFFNQEEKEFNPRNMFPEV